MPEDLASIIRGIPKEAFREPRKRFDDLTSLERLRWLQQTAYFIWKYKGAARAKSFAPARTTRPRG